MTREGERLGRDDKRERRAAEGVGPYGRDDKRGNGGGKNPFPKAVPFEGKVARSGAAASVG